MWQDNLIFPRGTKYPYDIIYRIFIPDNYDAHISYPLVLCAHGNGEDRYQNGPFWADATRQATQPCFVLEPSCPNNHPQSIGSSQWILDVESHDGPVNLGDTPKNNTTEEVMELIASICATYTIDPDRIYMQGFSMGGDFTWEFPQLYPGYFAAVAPMHGDMDLRPAIAEKLLGLPLWAFTAADDAVVFPLTTDTVIGFLRDRGAAPRYTKYNTEGHDTRNEFNEPELYNWMMSQRRSLREPISWTRVECTDLTADSGSVPISVPGSSGGTELLLNEAGSFVEYSFTGTSVKIIGSRNTGSGMAQVYLDGSLISTLNTSSPNGLLLQQEIFCKLGLAGGTHTIRIVATGTGGVQVNFLLFSGCPPPPVSPDIKQLNNTEWVQVASRDLKVRKSGNWKTTDEVISFNKYLSYYCVYSNSTNDVLEFTFRGRGIIVIGRKCSDGGMAAIYLDGVLQTTIDTYYPHNASVQCFFLAENLKNKSHTIKVVVKGTKNPASTDANIYIDELMHKTAPRCKFWLFRRWW